MLTTLYNYAELSKKRCFGSILTHADHIWHVISCEQPIELKQTQEKKTRSTVLNPRRAKFYDFQVLTGALHTVYRAASSLFKKYTRYLFQRDTSSEAVVIAIVEAEGLKSVTVAAVYIYTCSSLESHKLDTISYPPIPTFISLSIYFHLCGF